MNRALLSPDGRQYAYFASEASASTVHVLDVATNTDTTVYRGSTLYFPIAFESEGIYLVHAVAPRQGAFEKLYRLDPSGGTPQLVPGSDRHMYQWGWVMIAYGAAWGIDTRVQGNTYFYSVLRLDLATSRVTQWFEGPADKLFWPLGVDGKRRLFVADQDHLIRVDQPGLSVSQPDGGPVTGFDGPGQAPVFASDARGAWFASTGGVWLYPGNGAPEKFTVGPSDAMVAPAGPCL